MTARPRAWVLGLWLAGGCTVADNLSYEELRDEYDGIVRVAGTAGDQRIDYAHRAPVSAWYMRYFWLYPLRWPLGVVFGVRRTDDLDNARGHARTLLLELPDESGSDLQAASEVILRCGWLAELEPTPGMRLAALDVAVALLQRLAIPAFAGDYTQLGVPLPDDQLAAARATVQQHQPAARPGGPLPGAARDAYLAALARLAERPLPDTAQRLQLVEQLRALWLAEADDAAGEATAAALRRALGHAVEWLLLRNAQGRDPALVDVRLAAMEHVRRLGGPRAVPLLLAVMAARPDQLSRNEPRFDPDPLVQLRLVHYCGQLQRDLAYAEVRLPGADRWEPIAPVDFLAQTILTESAYYSKLRTPAVAALALSLGRPLAGAAAAPPGQSPEAPAQDLDWVKAWAAQRQAERIRGL